MYNIIRVWICLKILYSNFLFIHHKVEVGIWLYMARTALVEICVATCLNVEHFVLWYRRFHTLNIIPQSQKLLIQIWNLKVHRVNDPAVKIAGTLSKLWIKSNQQLDYTKLTHCITSQVVCVYVVVKMGKIANWEARYSYQTNVKSHSFSYSTFKISYI